MTSVITRSGPDAAPEPSAASSRLVVGSLLGLATVLVLAVLTGNGIYALGAFGFVVALLVSVTLHEGGHFLTARRYGMKATQFFVGFGPTIWSRRTGETEWGIKAIPAGGFVKIVGMTQLEEVEPGDEQRAFWRQPARQRIVVLAAGSTVHFIIAVLLVLLSALTIGKAVQLPPGIAGTSACVPATATSTCTDAGALPAPAAAAGLRAGDTVVAVQGRPVADVEALVRAVRQAPGTPIEVTVQRDGARRTLSVTPVAVNRPSLENPRRSSTVGAIGIQIQYNQGTERLGPIEAVRYSGTTLVTFAQGIVTTLTDKLGTITRVYSPDRDPNGFIGVVGAGRISGEVLASTETLAFKILGFLGLMAGLNLFVGVFNLLPLMPLDGGHIAVLLFEQARHRAKRLFGYTGVVQRVDLRKLLPLTYLVVLLFAAFTLWLLGADIVNPIRIG